MACCIPSTAKLSSLNSSFISRPNLCTSKRMRRSRGRISVAIPDPAFDPESPFAKKLSDAIASNPEAAQNQSRSDKRPPLLHMLNKYDIDKETRRKRIDHFIKNSPLYFHCEASRRPPPDLPSVLLDQFIVCIDYPLVSLVSELVIAQLLYLQNRDPFHPIYLYINSTGTSREDGQKVAFESDGFAIYDVMNGVFNEIRTVVIGQALGHACLLFAAGKKGWRYMFPNAIAGLEEPRVFASGQLQEADVAIRTKEAIHDRDLTIKLFAKHTGNSSEVIAKAMRMKKTMWPREAIEFGIADKVLLRDSQNTMMKNFSKPEEYAKKASTPREGPYGSGERGLG